MKITYPITNNDLVGSESLKTLHKITTLGTVHKLTLSFQNIQFIDASGIAVLVRLYSHFNKCLVIKDVPQHIDVLLATIGLKQLLVN